MSTWPIGPWISALPAKPLAAQLLAKPLLRRVITFGVTFLATTVLVPLSPFIFVAAWLKDRLDRSPQSPTARVVLLVIGVLCIEIFGMVLTLVVAVRDGFGLFAGRNTRDRWQRYRPLLGWYAATQLRFICWVLQAPIDWRDHASISAGPVVVMARHTSFFDALIPSVVLARRNKLLPHHVVTAGLQFAPLIDLVGHRFPTCFISRAPGVGSRELGPIHDLATQLDDRSAAIIFPEGTFRSPDRFERAVRRVARRYPERAARAEQLQHTLPPRPSGLWALLQGCPEADLVVCTNTGLEQFGFVHDIVQNMPSQTPLVVETWRIDRATIPTEFEAFSEWLFAEFVKIDEWVSRHA